jgi:hypothetical protein
MNEIKLVEPERAQSEEQANPAASQTEIRVLEGFELLLTGGGDSPVDWP